MLKRYVFRVAILLYNNLQYSCLHGLLKMVHPFKSSNDIIMENDRMMCL